MNMQHYADQGVTQIMTSIAQSEHNIEIEIDEDTPDKVWIYMTKDGERVEGGSFDSEAFLNHVLAFYNSNY